MPKKIALDYDDSELRIVVANCNSSRVQVTDARVIPIAENESVSEKLRAYITGAGLQKTETLVAIGRGTRHGRRRHSLDVKCIGRFPWQAAPT